MKRSIIICLVIMLGTSLVFAQEVFKAVTKDGEVTDVGMVQIQKISKVDKVDTYTLNYLNTELAVISTQIQALQAKKAELEALKIVIGKEATKIKLKEAVILK